MKKMSIKNKPFVPAGHESEIDPAVLKKVILTAGDLKLDGMVQMINWACMAPGKQFSPHYHEKMDELFIIVSGQAEIKVGMETTGLEATDTIFIPMGAVHVMENTGDCDLEYIAIGIVKEPGGKTVVVE